jgi:hypothetical protein
MRNFTWHRRCALLSGHCCSEELANYTANTITSNFHTCTHSPSLSARMPIITHTCHYHYAHQPSMDLLEFPHVLIAFPISVCSSVSSLCQHYCHFVFPVQTLSVFCFMSVVPLNVHTLYLLLVSQSQSLHKLKL